MICFLCHDELTDIYYRICICEDSVLCQECYEIMNSKRENIKNKCSICQRQLNIIEEIDICKNILYLIPQSLNFIISNGYLLITPLHIYYYSNEEYPNKFFTNKNIFLYFTTISTFIIRYISHILIYQLVKYHQYNNNVENDFIKMRFMYDLLIFLIYTSQMIINFIDLTKKKSEFYFVFFELIGLVTPMMTFLLSILFINFTVYYSKISQKNAKLKIKYEKLNIKNQLFGETEV